jgi:hypothetical protein
MKYSVYIAMSLDGFIARSDSSLDRLEASSGGVWGLNSSVHAVSTDDFG